jgi:tRNA pseudouridine38-40 synthase
LYHSLNHLNCNKQDNKNRPEILKYFLNISYNGANYHGWQVQQNAHTVQQELNNALKKLFQQNIESLGSGRTDTGVHAVEQVVQMELAQELTENHIFKLNAILPNDIYIKDFHRVRDDASARFDATSRTYHYKICNVKDPFHRGLAYLFYKELDMEKMNKAAKILFRHKDFQAFSKVNTSVDHFLCDIIKAEWKMKNGLMIFEIEANRFLRGMVRSIVGTLIEVGLGRMSLADFEKIIQSKDRKKAGRAVPAEGLYLMKIKYPRRVFLV